MKKTLFRNKNDFQNWKSREINLARGHDGLISELERMMDGPIYYPCIMCWKIIDITGFRSIQYEFVYTSDFQ